MSKETGEPRKGLRERAHDLASTVANAREAALQTVRDAYDTTAQRVAEVSTTVRDTAQELTAKAAEQLNTAVATVNAGIDRTVEGIVMTAEVPATTLYNAYDNARLMATGKTLTQELGLTEAEREMLLRYVSAEILAQVHGPAIDSLISRARAAVPQQEAASSTLPAVRDRRTVQPETVISAAELAAKGLLGMAARRFEDRMIAAPGQQINTAALRQAAQGLVGHAVEGMSNVSSFDQLTGFASTHAAAINDVVATYRTAKNQ